MRMLKQAQQADLKKSFQRLDESDEDIALIRLAKRCLEVHPDARPQDAGELASEMSSYRHSKQKQAHDDMVRFFELSLDLFCIAGFDGYFRRINGNFSRVLGHSEQELMSRPFLDFVHPEDRGSTLEVMGQLLEGQPVVRFHNRYLAASGEYVEFEWTSKSIPSDHLIFAVARKIT